MCGPIFKSATFRKTGSDKVGDSEESEDKGDKSSCFGSFCEIGRGRLVSCWYDTSWN